jgi:bifunctional DNase/RNase
VSVERLANPGFALGASLAIWLAACGGPRPALIAVDAELRAVVVEGVRVDQSGEPVLTLLEKGGELRRLPIWIGQDQAQSIHVALSEIALPRPNTHDLLVGMLGGLERRLERVAITELRDATYYAVIDVAGEGGTVQFDARPSDAIALAVRTGAAIFVAESVLAGGAPGGDSERGLDVDWRGAAPSLPLHVTSQSRSRRGV